MDEDAVACDPQSPGERLGADVVSHCDESRDSSEVGTAAVGAQEVLVELRHFVVAQQPLGAGTLRRSSRQLDFPG